MSSNVDYNICPECLNLNSATVWFVNENMYQIVCKECAHEFECGRLPWQSIRLVDMDVYDDRDGETGETGHIGDPGSDDDDDIEGDCIDDDDERCFGEGDTNDSVWESELYDSSLTADPGD